VANKEIKHGVLKLHKWVVGGTIKKSNKRRQWAGIWRI